jgi:hypothetical protein
MYRGEVMQVIELKVILIDTDVQPKSESNIKELLATLAEDLTDEELARPRDIAGRPGEVAL